MNIPNYKLKENEKYRICKIEEKLTTEFFTPHQHNYFEMIFFTNTSTYNAKHSIDFKSYSIEKNRIFFVAKEQAHEWLDKELLEDYKGYFIVFNESFVQSYKVLLELFDFLNHEPFIDLSESEEHVPLRLIELIEEQQDMKSQCYQQSLIDALLHFLVEKKKSSLRPMDINQERFVKLRNLIAEHYKEEKQVLFYAKKMDLSVKRLDVIAKLVSPLSVTELIHKQILLQAKRELSLGLKTVTSIAFDLGYHDPSYFSKFFKKHEGISPSEFMSK